MPPVRRLLPALLLLHHLASATQTGRRLPLQSPAVRLEVPDACPAAVLSYSDALRYGGSAPSDESHYHVALALFHGAGAPRDAGRALQLLTRTCLRGHSDACVCAGHAYDTGQGSGGMDAHSAYSYYKRAANAGNARGALGAALLLYADRVRMHGSVSEQTHDMITLLRAAIEGGIAAGQFYLAAVLEYAGQMDDFYAAQRRRDRPMFVDDFEEAAALYADACASRVPAACYHHGLMLYHGRGIPQDFTAAFLAFQRELGVANGSHASAAYFMAVLHGHGRAGGPADDRIMQHLLGIAVQSQDEVVGAYARMLREDLGRRQPLPDEVQVPELESRTAALLNALGHVDLE